MERFGMDGTNALDLARGELLVAVDKLIDSTQLDACCTAEANAIRAKTGGSALITYDWANSKGFADAIAAIPTGSSDTWSWMGKNPTLVQTFTERTALADTSFATWTPSTTAKALSASNTYGTISLDLANYEYLIGAKFRCKAVYLPGATLKNTMDVGSMEMWRSLCRYPTNSGLQNRVLDGAFYGDFYEGVNKAAQFLLCYYDGTGAIKGRSVSNSLCGIYATTTLIGDPYTVGSTANLVSATIKRGQITARCNANFFATDRAAEIDQDNTFIEVKFEIWRIDKNTGPFSSILLDSLAILDSPIVPAS